MTPRSLVDPTTDLLRPARAGAFIFVLSAASGCLTAIAFPTVPQQQAQQLWIFVHGLRSTYWTGQQDLPQTWEVRHCMAYRTQSAISSRLRNLELFC